MPASDNFPFFGVAEAMVPGAPSISVELRLDPEDAARAARLGARATVTAVTGEGTVDERIARLDVGFGTLDHASDRVKVVFDAGTLRTEAP
jgi:hypothetical protein